MPTPMSPTLQAAIFAFLVGISPYFEPGLKQVNFAGLANGATQEFVWSVAALKIYQALLAGMCYLGCALACHRVTPSAARWLMLLSAVAALPLYSVLSCNGAGGSYDNFVEMFTRLPNHSEDIERRTTSMKNAHRVGLRRERENGVYRMVNGVEASVAHNLVTVLGAVGGFVVDWRSTMPLQVACVVLLNLAIAFASFGLPYQWPEALWEVRPDGSVHPMRSRPVPSY